MLDTNVEVCWTLLRGVEVCSVCYNLCGVVCAWFSNVLDPIVLGVEVCWILLRGVD